MTEQLKIAVLDDYLGVAQALADWDHLGAAVTVFPDTIGGPALVERLAPFDVICLMRERTPFPADLIAALPRLRLIVTSGKRNLAIDLAAAKARGITVCGTESRGPATAQHTLGLILAANRCLVSEALSVRDGGWQRSLGRDLDGLTLGLIGLGRLGAEVATLTRPLGVRLVAWSQNLTEARAAGVGVERMPTLSALMAASDTVSIHLVLSERSRGLIDAAALADMKPDAVLVNTSRGPIVETEALLAALRAGRLGAAALDVFDTEPLPLDDPLRDRALIDAGKLILTPHIGYGSRQTYEIFYRQTVEAIAAWKAGNPIRELRL
ncbi:MAG: D-2-hydroxyacid dehydrogenase family protein [Pseudomonadota bacterium]